jgi:hypothetical protein
MQLICLVTFSNPPVFFAFFLLPDDHFLNSSFIARIESNDLYLDITPLSNRRDHSISQTFLVLLLQIFISIISIDKYIEIIADHSFTTIVKF